jgi:GAF domain-containing protein
MLDREESHLRQINLPETGTTVALQTRGRIVGEAERYRTLLEINNAIITKLTQEDLFRAICEALKNAIAFDRAGLTLYDPTIDALRVFALVGDLDRFAVGQILPLSDPDSGRPFDFRHVRLLRDLETEREHSIDHLIYAEGIRSYCTAPLTLQGAAIGTIGVGSVNKNQYSEATRSFCGRLPIRWRWPSPT